jgi:uncharacterized protein YkwD
MMSKKNNTLISSNNGNATDQLKKNTKDDPFYIDLATKVKEEINNCRKNPLAYIPLIEIMLQTSDNKYKADIQDAIEFIKKQKNTSLLSSSDILTKVARDHAEDIGINGLFTHIGSDGKDLDSRMDKYTEWAGSISENMEFDNTDCSSILLNWLIDAGVKNKIHRHNIFSSSFNYIGIAAAKHESYNIVVVANFAELIITPDLKIIPNYKTNQPYPTTKTVGPIDSYSLPANTYYIIKKVTTKSTFMNLNNRNKKLVNCTTKVLFLNSENTVICSIVNETKK